MLFAGLAAHFLICTAVPSLREEGATWALFSLVFVVSTSFRLIQDRRIARAPWLLILVAGITGPVASIGYHYPSWNDLVSYGTYLLLIAAMATFQRLRSPHAAHEERLDALMVAASAAAMILGGILSEYLRDESIPGFHRAGNVIYSAMTITIVALTARLALAPGTRNTSWTLLACSIGLLFTNDLLVLLDTTGSTWSRDVAAWIGPLTPLFTASAILHPQVADLTNTPDRPRANLSRVRLAMVGTALLTVPLVVLASRAANVEPNYYVLVPGAIALALLALGRLNLLFRAQEAQSAIETILRQVGEQLLQATEACEIQRTVVAAVPRLLDTPLTSDPRFVARQSPLFAILSDAAPDEPYAPFIPGSEIGAALGLRSGTPAIAAPIGEPGNPLGYLLVEMNQLSAKEASALARLTNQAALALTTAELRERLTRERAERRFRSLVQSSSDIIFIIDGEQKIEFVSPAVNRFLEVSESALMGKSVLDLIAPRQRLLIDAWLRADDRSRDSIEVQLEYGGLVRWFELRLDDLRLDPEIGGLVLVAREVSDRRAAEERRRDSERRFRALVQSSSDIVIVFDADGRIDYVSPSISDLGYRPDELVHSSLWDVLNEESRYRIKALITEPFPGTACEFVALDTTGREHPFASTITDMRRDSAVGGIVINARDVSESQRLREDLDRLERRDQVTDLPNRASAIDALDALIGASLATDTVVVVLHVDHLAFIREAWGKSICDDVLRTIAGRLRSVLRPDDLLSKSGDADFCVTMRVGESDNPEAIAERLISTAGAMAQFETGSIDLAVDAGIAAFDGASSGTEWLNHAETAARHASDQPNRIARFTASLRDQAAQRITLAADVRKGLTEGEFSLVYQPIVELSNRRICAVEALVRWTHPTRGFLSPAVFIPMMEETGVIRELGEWVLSTACRQLAEWNGELDQSRQLTMDVNLSARQLDQTNSIEVLIDTVRRARVSPGQVTLELTENVIVEGGSTAVGQLDALAAFGFGIAVDDFGTGYSSLRYLEQLPLSEIKIDRSFVSGIDHSVNKESLFRHVIQLAADLGLKTVAEGIETEGECEIVTRLGCQYGQGYYYSKPVSAATITTMLGIGEHQRI